MKIDPKLKEAVDVLKFIDHRVREELKNREKSANGDASKPQAPRGDSPSPDLE